MYNVMRTKVGRQLKRLVLDGAGKIEGYTSETDLDVLYDLCQEYVQEEGYAIEVGGWKGRSTYVIASVCQQKGAILYAIDSFAGILDEDYIPQDNWVGNDIACMISYFTAREDSEFHRILKSNVIGLPVVILKGDSNEIYKFLPNRMFDFCFIDGDHHSPTIDNDIRGYWPKVRGGGMLCGHDHGNPEGNVHGAVDKLIGEQIKDWTLQIRPGVCTTIWSRVVQNEDPMFDSASKEIGSGE